MVKKYPKLSPQFIFLYPTFNFRNNEIGATIGLNQLKRLNKNNSLRTRNFKMFLSLLDDKNIELITMLREVLIMHFQLSLKTKILNLEMFSKRLKKYNIEFRRGNAGGGNN